jgi:hypothetical protein
VVVVVVIAGAELPLSLIEQLVTAITDPVIVEIVRSLEKIQVRVTHDTHTTRHTTHDWRSR